MGIYSYGYKAGKKILQKILKPQKTTGETINPFQRKTMRSDAAAKMGDIKVQLSKLKGGAKKLQTSMDDVRAAMRDRAKGKKSFSTGKELEQQEYFNNMNKTKDFNKGGRVGLRLGSKKSNIQKIQEVFGVKKAKKKEKPKKRMMAMGGGFAGRRMGYSQGSNGKPISKSKNPGILAMSKTAKGREVVKEKFKFNPDRIVAKKGGKA